MAAVGVAHDFKVDTGVIALPIVKNLRTRISGSVVDDQDTVIGARPVEFCSPFVENRYDRPLLVEDWNNNQKLGGHVLLLRTRAFSHKPKPSTPLFFPSSARSGDPASRCDDILKNVIMWDSSFTPRMNGSGGMQFLNCGVGLMTGKSVIGIRGRPTEGVSNQPVKKCQNAAGSVCQPETDFACLLALGDQPREYQAPHMLAGCFDLDLQLFGNLADTEIGLVTEQLKDLDSTVIGKAFDNALQTFGLGAFCTNHACPRSHGNKFSPWHTSTQAMMTFLRMSS
jgi:hypothetical protein